MDRPSPRMGLVGVGSRKQEIIQVRFILVVLFLFQSACIFTSLAKLKAANHEMLAQADKVQESESMVRELRELYLQAKTGEEELVLLRAQVAMLKMEAEALQQDKARAEGASATLQASLDQAQQAQQAAEQQAQQAQQAGREGEQQARQEAEAKVQQLDAEKAELQSRLEAAKAELKSQLEQERAGHTAQGEQAVQLQLAQSKAEEMRGHVRQYQALASRMSAELAALANKEGLQAEDVDAALQVLDTERDKLAQATGIL